MAGRNHRSKTSSDSGWIEVSATMDSGTAVAAAQIGRECVAHRASTRPAPGGTARPPRQRISGEARLSAFIACRVVSGSLFSIAVEVVLLGIVRPARRHHARVPRSRGQCAGQSNTLGHGKRALESLGRGSWRKRSISGVTCVMELSHQPHRPTPPCFRGLDAGSPQWTEMGTTKTRSAAYARSEEHHLSCSGLKENPLATIPRVDPQM